MSEFIDICEKAARAGAAVLQHWRGRFQVHEKAPADLVTEADIAAQEVIKKILLEKNPEHLFVGEEDPDSYERLLQWHSTGNWPANYCWIVDPLDGTTNYVHGMPDYCFSIALVKESEILVGAVYNPVSEECFTAVAGQGAFLNGRLLATSKVVNMENALIAASFPPKISHPSLEIDRFVEVMQESQAVRRLGSAAMNLCHLAAGRLDAYWATSVKPWDVAAGLLLVKEAGGSISAIDGGPFVLAHPKFAASATESLHEEFLTVLSRPGHEV